MSNQEQRDVKSEKSRFEGRLIIKPNPTANKGQCAICGELATPLVPYWVFVEDSGDAVCQRCVSHHDPGLLEMVKHQATKMQRVKDKKIEQSKEFFKGTALGDDITKANKKDG